jgi:oligopeptidase A
MKHQSNKSAIFAVMLVASPCSFARAFSSIRFRANLLHRRSTATRWAATASTETRVENPLLKQDGLPKFAVIQPEDLTPAVGEILTKLEKDFESFETQLQTKSSPDYEEVLPEIEKIQFPLGYVWGVAGHLNGVKNGDELRAAYEENQPKVVQAMTKFEQSKPLYDALAALEKQWKDQATESCESFEESQRRRAVEISLRSMTLGGVGLEGEHKERFNAIKMRLAELSNSFSNNLLDSTKSFSVTVDDPSAMEGVPQSAKAMWANSHITYLQQQDKEADVPALDAEKGPWRLTLDGPSYIAAMSHLPSRQLREQLYRAYVTRASESNEGKNNVPLIYEILQLKLEASRMLGFPNFAARSLAAKMAPSVESVGELTDLIAKKALPAAMRELAEVTALAREKGGEEYSEAKLSKLAPWDITYWSERLKETKFDMTAEELRPYFALGAVLDGMFGLVKRIFDIEVRAADGEAEVWHPDVRFFNVYSSGKHVASFYLDPYARPENKRGGAWMDVCIGKSAALKREIPVAYLTCNGSPPVGEKPSLMTFGEVETLFHEFGHGLQHMLTKANVGDVAGINGVEWDAVELPSQFMENWCYDRPTVYGFAKHWQTGEPLPEEMFEKLKAQKTFNAGMMACRQLYLGQLDMELYSSFDPYAGAKGEGESIFDVQRRIAGKYIPYSMPLEEDRFLCSFSHIFAGGYAAGYYS